MDLMAPPEARYVALPFTPTPERAEVVSRLMRGCLPFETIFTDYQRACDAACGECDECRRALVVVARFLADANTRSWEVWSEAGELVGLLALSRVIPGVDAEAHYVFFDRKLVDKTALLESVIDWAFEDHEDWRGLQRLSVLVPDYAFTLARHAHRYLGFGGDFVYRLNGKTLPVEGVKRRMFRWRGSERDLLQLGRVR